LLRELLHPEALVWRLSRVTYRRILCLPVASKLSPHCVAAVATVVSSGGERRYMCYVRLIRGISSAKEKVARVTSRVSHGRRPTRPYWVRDASLSWLLAFASLRNFVSVCHLELRSPLLTKSIPSLYSVSSREYYHFQDALIIPAPLVLRHITLSLAACLSSAEGRSDACEIGQGHASCS
jgi:hypothetical protein